MRNLSRLKKNIISTFCILSIVTLLFVGCKKEKIDVSKQGKGGTAKIVMPWSQLTFNLNPFMTAGNRLAIVNEIYECLYFITFTSEEIPLLATSYKWANNNMDLIFELRKDVKWNDGQPFTSKDVVFTYNYIKEHKALDQHGIWAQNKGLKSVEADGEYKVVFKFSIINVPFLNTLIQVLITPEHIWSNIEAPSKSINENPVGTGPFLFEKFSKENNIIYAVKNPNYWDKVKPYVDAIEMHSVKDNGLCLLAMLKGQADWSYTFVENIKKVWADKNPEDNKYWKPVLNSVIWYLNNEKPPLDNPKFRKALGMALDKELMSDNIYHGIGEAHVTGIPDSQQDQWIPAKLKSKGYAYDIQKAQKLLAEIGYNKKGDNLIGPDGEAVRSFKILVGAGWTDYIGLAQIIVDNLKKLGITATIDQQPWNTYFPSFQTGTYDTGICWGQGTGPTPYFIYVRSFSEIKQDSNTNFSRYTKDDIAKALNSYQQSNNPKVLKNSIATILELMLEDVPYIPLTHATAHHIFSEKTFIGWPSNSNPSAEGAPDTQGVSLILSNIYLK